MVGYPTPEDDTDADIIAAALLAAARSARADQTRSHQ